MLEFGTNKEFEEIMETLEFLRRIYKSIGACLVAVGFIAANLIYVTLHGWPEYRLIISILGLIMIACGALIIRGAMRNYFGKELLESYNLLESLRILRRLASAPEGSDRDGSSYIL